MDEYTKNKIKNFIKEDIPANLPPLVPDKSQKSEDAGIQSKLMNNVIIGNHNIILTNAISYIIISATVLCAVAFFY